MDFVDAPIPFVVIGDTLVAQSDTPFMAVREWAKGALCMDDSAIEMATCGYFMQGRVQFYTGGSKFAVSTLVTCDVVEKALTVYYRHFPGRGGMLPVIGNGCIADATGAEQLPILVFVRGYWEVYRRD